MMRKNIMIYNNLEEFIKYRPKKLVLTGGFYDPCHIGHIKLLIESLSISNYLLIAINSDEATIQKKGYCLLPFEHRAEVVQNILYNNDNDVTGIIKNNNSDMLEIIEKVRPSIYTKGGDRTPDNMLQSEIDLCASIGCEIRYGVGGYDKSGSSSDFFKKAVKQYNESIYPK